MSIETARRVADTWLVKCVKVFSADLHALSVVRNRRFSNAYVNVLKCLDVTGSK